MEKITNINKAPKDDVLNQIMQEIDDENISTSATPPTKKKKSLKKQKAPEKKSWTRWIVYFIFLIIIVSSLFVLMLIIKATKEVTKQQVVVQDVVTVEKVENNSSIPVEKNVIKPNTEVKKSPEKPQDNLIIFDMKAKTKPKEIEQAPYIPLENVQRVQKPLSEREKAKAALREQMNL